MSGLARRLSGESGEREGSSGTVCALHGTVASAATIFIGCASSSIKLQGIQNCICAGLCQGQYAVQTYFLNKTVETYPIDQLERDGKTVWDGVKNPRERCARSVK